ncbi:MAG: hypothetical protein V3S43_00010 [Acidimicrobiia bacterium]
MASRRLLVSAITNDALADQDIRTVDVPSVVNLWAGAVTVTDTIGLRLDKTIIMDDGTANVRAAALGLVDVNADQLVFNSVVGPGTLRVPVAALTTSLIFIISVEPIL